MWKKLLGDCEVETLDPQFYKQLLGILPQVQTQTAVAEALLIAGDLDGLARKSLSAWGVDPGQSPALSSLEDIPSWGRESLRKLIFFRKWCDKLAYMRATGKGYNASVTIQGWTLSGDDYMVLLHSSTHDQGYFASYEQILMFKDMLWARFNVALALQVIYPTSSLSESVKQCLEWCLECVELYGNRGYEVMKNIESLTKTNLIRVSDPYLGENGSHDSMLEVVREKERRVSGDLSPMTDKLNLILSEDRELSHAVELFGLQKLSGHPCVDPVSGAESIRQLGQALKVYHYSDLLRIRNNFRRMYSEGHIRKLGKWPVLNFPRDRRATKLYQLYTLKETKITPSSYPLSDWDGVSFEPSLDFEYYPNFTDLMDDKAISYYRDEISKTWDRSTPPTSHKRLLLEMLSKPEVSVKEIVRKVQTGIIPFRWLIVSLYPKEKEFKIDARMFAMMVFEMRVFFTACEANVADNVFPFLPPQTMTLSKQEIVEMFHSMTDPGDGREYVRVYAEFDVSKWNSNFKAPPMDPIFRDLDDLHGEKNLFPVIHHFFPKAAMMTRVAGLEPHRVKDWERGTPQDPDAESGLLYTNHSSGIEGINQKPWSIATYSCVDLALQKFGIKYYLIGQGDNQICLALVDSTGVTDIKGFIRDLSDRLVKAVHAEFKLMGHSLKEEECTVSTTMITYSKDVYINGVEYFTSLKACSKIFPHSASDFPAINNSVSALGSQCIAAAERMKDPFKAYYLWVFHCSWYLLRLRHSIPPEAAMVPRGILATLGPGTIRALLLLPGDLGGLTITPFTHFLYKGGADPLTKSYSALALQSKVSRLARILLGNILQGRWMVSSPDPTRLLDDPYSLPVRQVTTPEMTVLKEGVSTIHARAANRDIKELCGKRVDDYDSQLSRELLKTRPFNPVLLADIRSSSVVGVRQEVAKMFVTTRTVQTLLQRSGELSPCTRILSTGAGYFLSVRSRIDSLLPVERVSGSIFQEVTALRALWFPDGSATIEGVTSLSPFECRVTISHGPDPGPGVKVLITTSGTRDLWHTRGKESPYLGRSTVEKRSSHGYKIVASSSPERAIARLVQIATQPGVGDQFKAVVANVALTRADVDLVQTARQVGDAYGGSLYHRYSSILGHQGANFLGGITFVSHCLISTDFCPPISGGEDDYPVMVQEHIVAGQGLLNLTLRSNRSLRCIRLDMTSSPITPLENTELRVPMLELPPPVTFSTNAMVYATQILLKKLSTTTATCMIGPLTVGTLDTVLASLSLRRLVRRGLMRSRAAAVVADKGSGKISFKLDMLELRGFGFEIVCRCVALEIGRYCVSAFFSRSGSELRWSPLPLIISLSSSAAASLSPAFHHPLFKNDPEVIALALSSPLSYQVGPHSATARLGNRIAGIASSLISDPSSPLFTSPSALYADDFGGDSLTELISVVQEGVYRSVISGECPIDLAYTTLRRDLPRQLRLEVTEDAQLPILERSVLALELWARDQHMPILRKDLHRVLHGEKVLRAEVPATEAVREARRFPGPLNTSREPGDLSFPPFPNISLTVMEGITPDSGQALQSPSWLVDIQKQVLDEFAIARLCGRIYGRDSSAGYSYTGICDLVLGKTIVHVGVGYGSGSAVLLASGCEGIIGMDLVADLQELSLMAGNTTPPALSYTCLGNKFTRFSPPPGTSGSIFDHSTIVELRKYVGASCTWVVDIPLTSRVDVLSLFASLNSFSRVYTAAIRILSTHSRFIDIARSIGVGGAISEVRVVYSSEELVEGWLVINSTAGVFPSRYKTAWTYQTVALTPGLPDLSFLGGGIDYLRSTMIGLYLPEATSDLHDVYLRTCAMLSSSVGDLEHRFTYNQWTGMLHSLVCLVCLRADDPQVLLRWILSRDLVVLKLGDTRIPVNLTTRLRRILTRTLPRAIQRT